MLIGANSRTVSSAVDVRMKAVRASLPPGIEAKTVLNRTRLVDATIATVTRNLSEGAILVVVVGKWLASRKLVTTEIVEVPLDASPASPQDK